MRRSELDLMTIEQLWDLHEMVSQLLTTRITSEKRELERRLHQLSKGVRDPPVEARRSPQRRRAYPRVLPKYRNPMEPSESWSGRGKQPRWLVLKLQAGHRLEDFQIGEDELRELRGSPALVP